MDEDEDTVGESDVDDLEKIDALTDLNKYTLRMIHSQLQDSARGSNWKLMTLDGHKYDLGMLMVCWDNFELFTDWVMEMVVKQQADNDD